MKMVTFFSVPIDDTDAKTQKMERPNVAPKPSHILQSESSTKVNKKIGMSLALLL